MPKRAKIATPASSSAPLNPSFLEHDVDDDIMPAVGQQPDELEQELEELMDQMDTDE